MIQVTSEEIKNLKRVGSGRYGSVYQLDEENAYKIYHTTISGYDGFPHRNPALRQPKLRFHLLKQKGKHLQYTDVLKDVVYVDGKFGGVCIPYYDGETLNHFMNAEYSLKMDISEQLLRNGKELMDHYIYPIDYKLNNIMYANGAVQIIDLDDYLTHVRILPDSIHKMGAIDGLTDSIMTLFGERDYQYYKDSLKCYLTRKKARSSFKVDAIEEFMKEKRIKHSYLLMDSSSDTSKVQELIHNRNYQILYLCPSNSSLLEEENLLYTVSELRKKGILLFDITSLDSYENYLKNFLVEDVIQVEEKKLKIR